jgi:hypothetical protein
MLHHHESHASRSIRIFLRQGVDELEMLSHHSRAPSEHPFGDDMGFGFGPEDGLNILISTLTVITPLVMEARPQSNIGHPLELVVSE